jgi:hypothetical protein
MLMRLLALARAPVELAEAEAAVGDEGAHAESGGDDERRAAHLSPAHLRSEVAKTERVAEPTTISAQGSAQEVAELEGVSPK